LATTNLEWTVLGFAAVIAVALTVNGVPSLEAAPSQSVVASQPTAASQAALIDRSRKGHRLSPAAPPIAVVLPPGCESQFGPLTKLVPASSIARRCLT